MVGVADALVRSQAGSRALEAAIEVAPKHFLDSLIRQCVARFVASARVYRLSIFLREGGVL